MNSWYVTAGLVAVTVAGGPWMAAQRVSADVQDEPVRDDLGADQAALQREHRPVRFRVAEIREHERVAVGGPGRG